eukprot:scaffold7357_cov195-Pinguiococcus_pyrenoidosus.AAC.1
MKSVSGHRSSSMNASFGPGREGAEAAREAAPGFDAGVRMLENGRVQRHQLSQRRAPATGHTFPTTKETVPRNQALQSAALSPRYTPATTRQATLLPSRVPLASHPKLGKENEEKRKISQGSK